MEEPPGGAHGVRVSSAALPWEGVALLPGMARPALWD